MTAEHVETAITRIVSCEERATICARTEKRLQEIGSPIVSTPERVAQLHRQVNAILDTVEADLAGPCRPDDAGPDSPGAYSADIGLSRASDGIQPVYSLAAAEILYGVALPILTDGLDDPDRLRQIAECLHTALMAVIGVAAGSYVDFLVMRLRGAQAEERRRIAREVHDRAAHAVGVALQNVDLFHLYRADDPAAADLRLAASTESMRDAIAILRALATEIRDVLGGRPLHHALESYLSRYSVPTVTSTIHVTGDLLALDPRIAEELYLALREAIHNAFLHADASTLEVHITVDRSTVVAEVTDNGNGFEPAQTTGSGLTSMKERLALIGGTLEIDSSSGNGVGIRTVIPLAGIAHAGIPHAGIPVPGRPHDVRT